MDRLPSTLQPGDKIGNATVLSVGRAKLPPSAGGKRKAGTGGRSKLEEKFSAVWSIFGDPSFAIVSEYEFHPERRWRFDFAFPSQMVAVELDGGVHTGGRHVRGKGFEADCEKLNSAASLGWTVIRFTAKHLAKRRVVNSLDVLLTTLREAKN